INCLVPIAGTPLADAPPVDGIEVVRLVATTRLGFPRVRVRLSAGRDHMSRELQVLCFLAGANSIFFGDKLLTAPNPAAHEDAQLFRAMGLDVSAPRRTGFQSVHADEESGRIGNPSYEDLPANAP